jgi:hypothetical protein
MKIALCFSGQPRFIEEVAPSIKENVIGNYDVDVFAHLWFDDDLQSKPYKYGGTGKWKDQRISSDAINKFVEIYNPKKILVQNSKKFLDSNLSDNYLASLKRYKWGAIDNPEEPNFNIRDVNNIISYYYSLQKVNTLKKEYEYDNDFKYDIVIKIRTDSIVHNKISYESFPRDRIYYSGNQNQPDGMINDWFNFGGSKVMDSFMNAFCVFDLCVDKCMEQTGGAWCCELIHRKMIDFFDIPCQALPIQITLPRF